MITNKRILVYLNVLQFTILGSLISRNHVLQKWMGLDYYDFSKVMLFFSIGAVISNIISSYILNMFNNRYVLYVTFILSSSTLILFYQKPTFIFLCLYWTVISFSFSLNFVLLISQATTYESLYKQNWISYFQSLSGLGAIIGFSLGIIANYFNLILDIYFPALGIFAFLNIYIISKYNPYQKIDSAKKSTLNLNFNLLAFSLINFLLILSVSQIIVWSGILLRDEFNVSDYISTYGALLFIVFESISRFFGDEIFEKINLKNTLLVSSAFTSLFFILIYFLHNLIIIILLCLLIGLFSGLIQPAVIKLTSKLNSNTEVNLSFLFLFQSFAFLIGPAYSGYVAQKYGIYDIYIYSSIFTIFIFFLTLMIKNVKTLN